MILQSGAEKMVGFTWKGVASLAMAMGWTAFLVF